MNNRIIELVRGRLLVGEKKYGHENISSDGRDFEREALEEVLDCMVYAAARIIELEDRRLINVIKNKKD